jgi:uncharacterized protein (DUF2141 family)
MKIFAAAALAATALVPAPAAASIGPDAAACDSGNGPAILATITGLKDRRGTLRLELYPPNSNDFLQDDFVLERAGKTFRRVDAKTPASGAVNLCIRVPKAGRYTLMFLHDRDSNRKFGVSSDGAGFPTNRRLGLRKPPAEIAMITVGPGVTRTTIKAQYMKGLLGFGPLG